MCHLNVPFMLLKCFLHFQERGKDVAFSCSELDIVLSEVEKVEKWKHQCIEITKVYVDDGDTLLGSLEKVLNKFFMLIFCF